MTSARLQQKQTLLTAVTFDGSSYSEGLRCSQLRRSTGSVWLSSEIRLGCLTSFTAQCQRTECFAKYQHPTLRCHTCMYVSPRSVRLNIHRTHTQSAVHAPQMPTCCLWHENSHWMPFPLHEWLSRELWRFNYLKKFSLYIAAVVINGAVAG